MSTNKTTVEKDFAAKSIRITRNFDAPVESVWRAFTEPALLDQWWGPAPWHVETKSMDFKEGGRWLYAMVGPEGERHWARMDYGTIQEHQGFDLQDSFTDENGNIAPGLPLGKGRNSFTQTPSGTQVVMRITYPNESDLQQIVEMGFEQGISMCLDQLEELLRKGSR
jgi:uncharacterized protein YndB with AHSA1/START domain